MSARLSARLLQTLGRLPPVLVVVLTGVLLASSSLGVGFFIADWFHLAVLDGADALSDRGSLDLFHFARPGDAVVSEEQGLPSPWWTADNFQASFWRPMSSLTHWLDHAMWGHNAVGHHITSLLWWAALLAVVVLFFRDMGRDSGRALVIATFAGLIYAVDDAHNWNFGWVANRNAVISVLFSVLVLLHYHRFRTGGRVRSLLFALGCYLVALAAGETSISVVLWVVAYELTLGTGSASRRLLAASPVLGGTLVYLVLWQQAGYGTVGSGLYISPFERPVDFVVMAVTRRVPLLLGGAVGVVPAEGSILVHKSLEGWDVGLAWLFLTVLGWALWPLLRRDAVCRFMALGALFSSVPVAATFPSNRLLLFPTIGLSWLFACFIVDVYGLEGRSGKDTMSPMPRLRSLAASVVFLLHVVVAPLALVGGTCIFTLFVSQLDQFAAHAELPVDDQAAEAQVLLLNAPDPFTPTYLALMQKAAGQPVPGTLWQVSIVPGDQVLRRTADKAFSLEAAPPGFLFELWESLFRASPEVAPGQVFRRGEMRVTADKVTDGRLERIEVQVERSLDDPNLHLLAWNGERWARVAAPPLGDCALLPMDGYAIPMGIHARDSLAHLCADTIQPHGARARQVRATSASDASSDSSAAAPSVVSGAPAARSPVSPGDTACSLEVSTGGPWTSRGEFACPESGPLRIVAFGDVGRPGRILDDSVSAAAALCSEQPCHLVTLAGDLLYGPGSEAGDNWLQVWDQSLASLQLPALAVLGNHEYRHEPEPEKKRQVLFAADGRRGLVLPAASYAARIRRGDRTLLAIAGLDTDSVANPGPGMPGLGMDALSQACAEGAPTLSLGHHPPSSQGRHHGHEAHVEKALQKVLVAARASGCHLVASLAGHDHDMQAYQPGCETEGLPGVIVSGAAGKGYRAPGPQHLASCRVESAQSRYHAGPRETGGVAIVNVTPETGAVEVVLHDTRGSGSSIELSRLSW